MLNHEKIQWIQTIAMYCFLLNTQNFIALTQFCTKRKTTNSKQFQIKSEKFNTHNFLIFELFRKNTINGHETVYSFFKFQLGIWFDVHMVYTLYTKDDKNGRDQKYLIRFYLFWYLYSVYKKWYKNLQKAFLLYHCHIEYKRLWEMTIFDWYTLVMWLSSICIMMFFAVMFSKQSSGYFFMVDQCYCLYPICTGCWENLLFMQQFLQFIWILYFLLMFLIILW